MYLAECKCRHFAVSCITVNSNLVTLMLPYLQIKLTKLHTKYSYSSIATNLNLVLKPLTSISIHTNFLAICPLLNTKLHNYLI